MILPLGINKRLHRVPFVSIAIIITCTFLLLLQTTSPEPQTQVIRWGYIPGYASILTLFSHMFIHGGWGHLIGNMLFFYLTGFKLEDALGHVRFALFYLAGGVAANGLHVLFAQNVPIPCVGASGAIAAVMGGFMILYPNSRIITLYIIGYLRGTARIPAWLYLGFWFAKEVFSFVHLSGPGSGIAFGAHVGGFAAGMIWMWAFFGWNRGGDVEAMTDGIFEEDDRRAENSPYHTFKLAVGRLLGLVVAGYLAGVGLAGGFENPGHPKNEAEWKKALTKFMQTTQSADELIARIRRESAKAGRAATLNAEYLRRTIMERVERQRRIAHRRETPPAGHRISFGASLREDLDGGLRAIFPEVPDVELKCALMREPDAYELIGGATSPPDELMEVMIRAAVAQGWLVTDAIYSDRAKIAYMMLIREDREVFAGIIERPGVFEGLPTIVYHSLTTGDYDSQEIPGFTSGGPEIGEDF